MRFIQLELCLITIYMQLICVNKQCDKLPISISAESTIIMAQVIFRHGDRNILYRYPKDRWRHLKYWPEGYGKLTNVGKRQQYNLGKWFQKRYQRLFPEGYSSNKVDIHSSDVERTIMSAEANAAGLFSPIGDQIWNEDLLWQPIPINIIRKDVDIMLRVRVPCPLYSQLKKKYFKKKKNRKLMKKFQKVFDYVSKRCGESIKTISDAAHMFDTLDIEILRNRTIPTWALGIYDDLKEIAKFYFLSSTATQQMARLKSGFFIKELLNAFDEKSKSNLSPNHTFRMYSAHDSTIVNLLNALGLYDGDLPPFASSVMFELHKIHGEFIVKIFYRKTPTDNVSPLNIPNCGNQCPLNRIFELYKTIIPTKNYKTECKIEK